MKTRISLLSTIALFALAAMAACSSDDYSAIGGTMPTDVSQDADSIEVPLPALYPTEAVVVTPLDTVPATDRAALYIGYRPEGAWRATPLIHFDVGDSTVIEENVPLGWADVGDTIFLRIEQLLRADDVSVVRQVRLYELAAPLSADDLLVGDVSTLFGAQLGTGTWLKNGDVEVGIPKAVVKGWYDSGMQTGLAVWHEAPPAPTDVYSNYGGLAGIEYTNRSRVDVSIGTPVRGPALAFKVLSDEASNFEVEADESFTHIERDPPAAQDLQIGSWIQRRLWLDFDLGPDTVPVDATVNSGVLVLQVRPDLTMQVRGFTASVAGPAIIDQLARTWESARSEAGDVPGVQQAWGRGDRQVIGGSKPFNPDFGVVTDSTLTELRIDVTEYVQRQVNEIGPDDVPAGTTVADVGLLIAFTSEKADLCLGVFYGLDQIDDLKPRLEITYTPPADTWE